MFQECNLRPLDGCPDSAHLVGYRRMALPSNQLTIFHYHVLRGGITEVIASSTEAVLRFLPGINSVTIVCGDPDNTGVLSSRLHPIALDQGKEFFIDVVPEIGYLDMQEVPDPALPTTIRATLSRYRGSIWWIHNYQLGKNPLFTDALLEFLLEDEEQTAVFHIHDFPECSRYDNLAFLNHHLSHPPYPVRPNIRYAAINARDSDLLIQSGIPENHVFLLNNPVKVNRLERSQSRRTKSSLQSTFGGEFPLFRSDRPLMLYPVRTIRRKNVLELGLVAALDPAESNLVVTLPGVSGLERPYSGIVERAFQAGLIPGLWGIGTRLEKAGITFTALLAAADMVGSSSVQEGFGYLYIDAGQMGVPLIARRLDVFDGIADVFDLQRCIFYDSLLVPIDRPGMTALKAAYRARLLDLADHFDESVVSRLEAEIGAVFSGPTAEFSYLSAEDQYRILERVRNDRELGEEIRDLNPEIFKTLDQLHEKPVLESRVLDPRFTLEGVAQETLEILESFGGSTQGNHNIESLIQGRLVQAFARVAYIRLLYG